MCLMRGIVIVFILSLLGFWLLRGDEAVGLQPITVGQERFLKRLCADSLHGHVTEFLDAGAQRARIIVVGPGFKGSCFTQFSHIIGVTTSKRRGR